ncbi:MAG: hypothetical protein M3Z31_16940 [Pseudomonadota bacterium]|nr:hypothetical protein [Pseudomonadota bacterium]
MVTTSKDTTQGAIGVWLPELLYEGLPLLYALIALITIFGSTDFVAHVNALVLFATCIWIAVLRLRSRTARLNHRSIR